jgi:hypothetical protein
VHAGIAAARADVGLERRLLGRVEHVPGGVEEDHGLVPGQARGGELAGVLGRGDGEVVGSAEIPDGLDAHRNRVVPEPGGLGEDQDVVRGVRGGRRTAAGQYRGRREGHADDGTEKSSHLALS